MFNQKITTMKNLLFSFILASLSLISFSQTKTYVYKGTLDSMAVTIVLTEFTGSNCILKYSGTYNIDMMPEATTLLEGSINPCGQGMADGEAHALYLNATLNSKPFGVFELYGVGLDKCVGLWKFEQSVFLVSLFLQK